MKKTMIVTLHSGQIIEKDLADFIKETQSNPKIMPADRLPINAPADHPIFQGLIQFTVTQGMEEQNMRSAKYFGWIAPSQIASAVIVFAES